MSDDTHPSTRYSALAPNCRERDTSIHSKPDFPLTSKRTTILDPHFTSRQKRKIYWRTIAFIVLEFIFLVLAYYCLLHPIPLQSHPGNELAVLPSLNVTLTELKAGITALSVVWHTLACFCVKDIIATVYSTEFIAQYRRFGSLKPGTSDRVSTITSGFIDDLVHFMGRAATAGFRIAFMAMLIVTVIGPLGSGTITVGTISKQMDRQLSVANVTAKAEPPGMTTIQDRASLAIRMERQENTTFGYEMTPENALIPWPSMGTEKLPDQTTLTYQSDVLEFHYQCSWAPNYFVSIENHDKNGTTIDVKIYRTGYSVRSSIDSSLCRSGIVQLGTSGFNHTFLFINYISFDTYEADSLLGNLSLSGVPNAFSANAPNGFRMDAAVLTCDPQSSVVSAEVTLSQNSLTARKTADKPSTGNITPNAALRLGYYPLPVALGIESGIEERGVVYPNPLIKSLFLQLRRPYNIDAFWLESELEPLSLDEISKNLNIYSQSVGKAYLNGVTPTINGTSTMQVTIDQVAE